MESKELLRLLEAVQDTPISHVDLSASTKRIKVDMDTRKITGYKEFGVIRDHLAETVVFEVKRYKGDTDLAEKHCAIHWENGENGGVLPVTEVDLSEDGHILMRWELSDEFTQFAGDIVYALHFFSIIDGGFTYHAATNAEHGKLGTTLNASAHSRNKITPSEIEVYIAKMNALSAEIDQKIDSLEMTDEQAQKAVNNYLSKNPVKDGADGKSAYEYAKDGGYTGTEAEFAEKLAMEVPSKEEFSRLSLEKVDKSNITLDKHTDGLIYIFIDGKPVGNGVEVTGEVVEGDVIGNLDENNNLLLSGDIADGTYTLKWLKDDGTYTDAGNLVVSSITKYAINTTLSNCSASGATTINGGGSATVTITASSGYELPDTITVSGASYTWDKSTGNIVLSNPTSDVQISVTAEKVKTNFAEPNDTNTNDWSIWCNNARVGSDGAYRSSTTQHVTNYIPVQNGDIIHWYNMPIHGQMIGFYDSDKKSIATTNTTNENLSNYVSDCTIMNSATNDGQFTIIKDNVAFIRFTILCSNMSNYSNDNVVINVERNGEYL